MEAFKLDGRYSTTHRLTRAVPSVEERQPGSGIIPRLFVAGDHPCHGGLRTRAYFKERSTKAPLITVITVVYNGAATIEQAILSVLNQTYENVEFIIIDGGSHDGTLDIIRKYEAAIDYWVSESDNGIYDAMNKGIVLGRGDWTALLNADDAYIDCNALRRLAEMPSECMVAASDVVMLTKDGENLFRIDESRAPWRNIPYMHTGMYVRSQVYREYGLYDTQYRIAADIEFVFRLRMKGLQIGRMQQPMVRMRAGGLSNSAFKEGREEFRRIYSRYGGSRLLGYGGYFRTIIEQWAYEQRWLRAVVRKAKRLIKKTNRAI